MSDKLIFSVEYAEGIDDHALILCCPSGIVWEHQCDHYNCKQNIAEGVLLHIKRRDLRIPDSCCRYYADGLNADRDEHDISMEYRKKIADEIQGRLIGFENFLISHMRFDYSKIEEMVEAWIPVKVYLKIGNVTGDKFTPMDGYLCPENCD